MPCTRCTTKSPVVEALVVVRPLPRATRRAVHAPAAGEVGLGDERELRAGQHRAAIERRDHDVGRRADLARVICSIARSSEPRAFGRRRATRKPVAAQPR